MAVCKIIECQRDAWERDSGGLCLLHSRRKDKDKDGKFSDAVKEKLCAEDYDFRGIFFPGIADFSGQKFTEKAYFSGTIFKGDAYFFRTTFQEDVDFSAFFEGKADFPEATFSGKANFSGASFSGEADFSRATFSGEATFSYATFLKKADFDGAIFSGEAVFSGAIITATGELLLRYINFPDPDEENRREPFRAYFCFLFQKPRGMILFQNLSLEQMKFAGTDLRRVEFDQVTWASWWWRAAVYDEILLHQQRWAHIAYVLKHGGLWRKRNSGKVVKDRPEKPSYEDFAPVERLYRQLKINYEEERDFKRVGDFHYGEMEMHRRGSFWRQWLPFSWHNLYRVLNGYGERPLRAFIWLLLLIPAWAGLVWGLGMNNAGSQDPVSYGKTLFFILEKALLQRPAWPEGINGLGKILGSLSVLLLPGQAALFILALRNRLGRRR